MIEELRDFTEKYLDLQQALGQNTREEHIRQQIASFQRQGRLAEAERLEEELLKLNPGPPEEAEHVWNVFLEVCSSRRVVEGSPTTSISQEIDLWQRLYSVQLLPWEIRSLRMLDRMWCEWILKQFNAARSAQKQRRK